METNHFWRDGPSESSIRNVLAAYTAPVAPIAFTTFAESPSAKQILIPASGSLRVSPIVKSIHDAKADQVRVVELFCGAGGMGLGLTQAGFKVQRAYDNWQPALDIHRANLSSWLAPLTGHTHVRVKDLADLTRTVPEIADLKPEVIA